VARYLADTSAWNRATSAIDRWEMLLAADDVALCAPVRLELLSSARGRRDYDTLASDYRLLPDLRLDRRASSLAERTQAALAASSHHRGPKPMDLLIAAIAETHGVVLLHYDRHFDAIAQVTGQPTEWLAPRGSLR
jgi:predicted nucleic acid-binding protein